MLSEKFSPESQYVRYELQFKDALGWHCPGKPWDKATPELIEAWKPELTKPDGYGKVRLIGFTQFSSIPIWLYF